MNTPQIELTASQIAYEPGVLAIGRVSWFLLQPPRALELRLFWFTRGKGNPDVGIVETIKFDHPSAEDTRPFQIRLPASPPSFSGSLITLTWALELIAEPSKQVARQEIIIAPGGKEVRLKSLPKNEVGKWWSRFRRQG